MGRGLRAQVPRSSHADWTPPPRRRDPVEILRGQEAGRISSLLPIRHERMAVSPFTYFRGAAAVMAEDLAQTPSCGLRVQACGDAHLVNFGIYATPERRVVFDVNDFDETLEAPFEWDVKRLATSLVVAGRDRGFARQRARGRGTGGGGRLPHADGHLGADGPPGGVVRPIRRRRAGDPGDARRRRRAELRRAAQGQHDAPTSAPWTS